MNNATLDYLMNKMDSRRSRRDSKSSRDSEDYRDYRDYEGGDNRDMRDMRDYRGGEGRGTVDFEGSMDFEDSRRGSRRDSRRGRRDYEDSRDMRDYHQMPRMSKADYRVWKQLLENEDGTHGPHYDMQQIMSIAEKHNIRFEDFDEKEFCMAVNMMYSDYCKVAKKYVAPDKELAFFADLAKAFLEDEDGPEASEKLYLYFHCIVDA